jgi:HlyD family secretion protein
MATAILPRRAALARTLKLSPRRLLPVALLALGVLAYMGYQAWLSHRPYTWSGTVEVHTLTLGSRVGGRVQQVLVREGETVQPGQPLLILEPGDLPAQRLQAEGQLQQAQATLDKLVSGEQAGGGRQGSRTEQIARARAELRAAEASLTQAERDMERARTLAREQVITRADLDRAESTLALARSEREARRAALVELQRGREEDLRALQGAVEAARGRLQAIDVALSELTIRAPAEARVQSLDLRPGDLLAPNAPATTLVEPEQLYVRLYVPETQLGLLHVGQQLPVRVDTFPERTFSGSVESISSQGEYTPRNLQTADERANQVFAVRVGLDEEGRSQLRAGMAAYVTFPRP